MPTKNEIVLRPRFKINLDRTNESALMAFEKAKKEQKEFIVSRIDDNVYIKIPKREQHFWSPQLNIEIETMHADTTIVKGLFGPKPQLWTLFMFFHFAVAVAFIGFSIMTYVQWTLKEDYSMALMIVIGLPILWVVMYFLGRIGRRKGHKQMDELYVLMMKTLEE
jgi:Na+/melibiose symporter-like transporter